jgi:hypothetical protein
MAALIALPIFGTKSSFGDAPEWRTGPASADSAADCAGEEIIRVEADGPDPKEASEVFGRHGRRITRGDLPPFCRRQDQLRLGTNLTNDFVDARLVYQPRSDLNRLQGNRSTAASVKLDNLEKATGLSEVDRYLRAFGTRPGAAPYTSEISA